MSTTRAHATHESYLADERSLRSWLLTTDHKRIACSTWHPSPIFFFIGGAAAGLMRLNLMSPNGLMRRPEML